MADSTPPRRRRSRIPLGELLGEDSVALDAHAASRDDAIRATGELLVSIGAVDATYVDAMLEREQAVSTYVGEGIAFPHATSTGTGAVLRDAIVVLRFPDGVDWDGERVNVAVGIAAEGRGHIGILSQLAQALLEPTAAGALRDATSIDQVRALLGPS